MRSSLQPVSLDYRIIARIPTLIGRGKDAERTADDGTAIGARGTATRTGTGPTAGSYQILALAGAMTARRQSQIWIGSIVVDCRDLPRMIAFWQGALHYVPRDPPEPDGVVLKDPTGRGPNLSLNLTSEGPLDDYRIHLDLYSSNPEEEVVRLLRLGATLKKPAEKGHDFVTLADPDGNLFDVIDKKGWAFGQHA